MGRSRANRRIQAEKAKKDELKNAAQLANYKQNEINAFINSGTAGRNTIVNTYGRTESGLSNIPPAEGNAIINDKAINTDSGKKTNIDDTEPLTRLPPPKRTGQDVSFGPEALRYPKEEIHETTDYLRIRIVSYTPIGKPNSELPVNLLSEPGSRRNSGKKIIGTILLPIPSNIQDGNAVSYSDSSMNALTAALASGSINTMEGFGEAAGLFASGKSAAAGTAAATALENIKSSIASSGLTFDNAKSLITRQLAASAAGVFGGNVTIDQILAREQGVIFNPNMELLFNGPTLRQFRFSFKMTPRNQDESKEIMNIIRNIKRNMAPQTTTSGNSQNLFLKSPNVFELTYMQGSQPHSFLHNFKQCFLESMNVNYTGDGTYATYADGTPISMIMDLTFKELEPIYDIDYDNPNFIGPPGPDTRASGVGY